MAQITYSTREMAEAPMDPDAYGMSTEEGIRGLLRERMNTSPRTQVGCFSHDWLSDPRCHQASHLQGVGRGSCGSDSELHDRGCCAFYGC